MRIRTLVVIAVMAFVIPVYAQEGPVDSSREVEVLGRLASPLVGSWVLEVTPTGAPSFRALQTFHLAGTMNETSSILASLAEGPGHGVWSRDGDNYNVTFELFFFNEDHTEGGIIRVRETLKLKDADTMNGFAVVDILLPDGTVIENVDGAPVTATRVRVAPVRPEELGAYPKNAARSRRHW